MRIGGHVSIAGGMTRAVERQVAIGGTCGQTFFTGPSAWRAAAVPDEEMVAFQAAAGAADLTPWIAHAIYLINLASEDERIWQNSIRSLQDYRQIGARTAALGIVFHTGSHRGAGLDAVLPRVAMGLEAILAAQDGGPQLLLEVCAGQGGTIGSSFAELGAIIRALGGDPRLGICLDTCHVFAAGYDVRAADGVERTLEEFDHEMGLDRLVAIHANDSVFPLGSHRDRHANIGEGHIGADGFAALLGQPSLRALPWVLEVPGVDRGGPNLENITRLRELAGEPSLLTLPTSET
ncbi:MAG: deoxyribonuclease IV [Chloroflexota bacterium]